MDAHADVLAHLAPFCGLPTFARLLRLSRAAHRALDRASVWRDVALGEWGTHRAPLELLHRALGDNALKGTPGRPVEALLRRLLSLGLLRPPPFAAHFAGRRVRAIRGVADLLAARSRFAERAPDRGAAQPAQATDPRLARAAALAEAIVARLPPVAAAQTTAEDSQGTDVEAPSPDEADASPQPDAHPDDAARFLQLLRLALGRAPRPHFARLARFLAESGFPVCPVALLGTDRVGAPLQGPGPADLPVQMVELAYRAWRAGERGLLSRLAANGFCLADFAGPGGAGAKGLRTKSAADVWFVLMVRKALQGAEDVDPSEGTSDSGSESADEAAAFFASPHALASDDSDTQRRLDRTLLIPFARTYLRPSGIRLDRTALLLELVPAAVAPICRHHPGAHLASRRRRELEGFLRWFRHLEVALALPAPPADPDLPTRLFESHLRSLARSRHADDATALYLDSRLVPPTRALALLRAHAESLAPSPWDPRDESFFAAQGVEDARIAGLLAAGAAAEVRAGEQAGAFGRWMLARCVAWEYQLGIVTCLSRGARADGGTLDAVRGKTIAAQQRIWPLLIKHSDLPSLSRLARAASSPPRPRRPQLSLPCSPVARMPGGDPESAVAELVLRSLRARFDAEIGGAVREGVRGLLKGRGGVPDLEGLVGRVLEGRRYKGAVMASPSVGRGEGRWGAEDGAAVESPEPVMVATAEEVPVAADGGMDPSWFQGDVEF
ncbi:hypothetical protein DFJ74DRAFT_770738 [Hyaloraphidium curvatum]|nr:hypothetical protein DFJ74DRAFT_770738 [Hyaloraphidium curvatum]